MLKIAASSKYAENASALSVADEMMILMSSRKRAMSLIRPKSTSVWSVRSCASSIIMTE